MDYRISKKQLDFLMKNLTSRVVELPKNCVINQEKSHGQIAVILSGMVYLCVENDECDRSILDFFRPYECFMHNMLIPVEDGLSYFLIKSNSKIVYFSVMDILELSRSNYDWIREISEIILYSTKLSLLNTNLILHNKNLRGKIMSFFRREAEIQNNSTITIPIPFSDLSDFLSVERTAMMKEIRKLKDLEIISGKNRKITLLRPELFSI